MHRAPLPASVSTLLLATLLLLAACASAPEPAPVPVVGPPSSLQGLAGHWWGEYSSAETGRSGRIRFDLAADGESAHGDVLMLTHSAGEPALVPANRTGEPTPATLTLDIRFVELDPEDGSVAGMLEPYRDPVCGCILSTVFVGWIDGDRIEGTFVSNGGPAHPQVQGRWRVDRQE